MEFLSVDTRRQMLVEVTVESDENTMLKVLVCIGCIMVFQSS